MGGFFYLYLTYGDFCGNLSIVSRRTDIQVLKNILIEKGYKPLFDTYTDSKSKLKVLCLVHGEFLTNGQLIKRGNGCRKCGRKTYSKTRRGSIDKIADRAEAMGLKLISEEFPNPTGPQVLTFECAIHGRFDKDHRRVARGSGCAKCGRSIRAEKSKKDPDLFEAELKIIRPDYVLVSRYDNNSSKVEVLCPVHGSFRIIPSDLLGGHGCIMCGNRSLGTQNSIANLIKEKGLEVIQNDRLIVGPLELDIYVASKNLAIEYCGLYWHTEDSKKKNAHINKLNKCNEKGIKLITIFSDEWMERKEQVKNVINAKLGLLPKIAARNCSVKEISKEESDLFTNKYHLQGSTRATMRMGLFYGEELVGIITGGPHHRQARSDSLVLNRLCFGPYSVMGGSSKLFKIFREKALKLGFAKIVSWSDNRWSDGGVYKALGFTLEEESKIDYSYCKGKRRFSKQSCQKNMLLRKGATGNTEKEMAESLGYKRIWDCGKKRWVVYL